MMFHRIPVGSPVDLYGSPRERGRQQAERCPDMIRTVQRVVGQRIAESETRLSNPGIRRFLEDLRGFHQREDTDIMAELDGIAAGFRIPAEQLFDYLMLSLVEDLDATGLEECTAFAAPGKGGGAVVAKNRDYRREHIAIQRVFRHRDPDWGGREVLCVGSLGSPGNFSSGMNSDGLAVADTATRTASHRIGRHRYFLLSRLQARCPTVASALAEIAATPHAGGGNLVLADETGCVAAVELGARAVVVEIRHGESLGRTNHPVAGPAAERQRNEHDTGARLRDSHDRLRSLHRLMEEASCPMTIESAAGILSHQGNGDHAALCRAGGRNQSETISGSIYATRERCLWFASGRPCDGNWAAYTLCNG